MFYPQAIKAIDNGYIVWRKDTITLNGYVERTWHIIEENKIPDMSEPCSYHELIKFNHPANLYLDLESDDKLITLDEFVQQRNDICQALAPDQLWVYSEAHRPGKFSMRVIFPHFAFEQAKDILKFVKDRTEGLFTIIDYSVYSTKSTKSLRVSGTYKVSADNKYIAKFEIPPGVNLLNLLVRPPGIKLNIAVKASEPTEDEQRIETFRSGNILHQYVTFIYKWMKKNYPVDSIDLSYGPDVKGNASLRVKGYFCRFKQNNHASNSMFINIYFANGNKIEMKCVCSDSDCAGKGAYDFPDVDHINQLLF